MTKRTPKALIFSLVAMVGGVFLFRKITCARRADHDEALLDAMVEDSFPASDPPAY